MGLTSTNPFIEVINGYILYRTEYWYTLERESYLTKWVRSGETFRLLLRKKGQDLCWKGRQPKHFRPGVTDIPWKRKGSYISAHIVLDWGGVSKFKFLFLVTTTSICIDEGEGYHLLNTTPGPDNSPGWVKEENQGLNSSQGWGKLRT